MKETTFLASPAKQYERMKETLLPGAVGYYTGDMANAPGVFRVTRRYADGGGECVDLEHKDGRRHVSVYLTQFCFQMGQRFFCRQDWAEKRARGLEALGRAIPMAETEYLAAAERQRSLDDIDAWETW